MLMSTYCHHTQRWAELILLIESQVLQEKGQAINRELQSWEPH